MTLHGVVEPDDAEEIEEEAIDAVIDAIDDLPKGARRDDEGIAEAARRALVRAVRRAIGKRPVAQVHVVRV